VLARFNQICSVLNYLLVVTVQNVYTCIDGNTRRMSMSTHVELLELLRLSLLFFVKRGFQ